MTVTTDLAVEWATSTPSGHEAYQARRLDIVRIFARHLQPLDPATEVPPEDVLDRRQWRIPPYLYSPQEVTALMSAARTLQPAFRALTWRTLIGLLAVTAAGRGLPPGPRRRRPERRDGHDRGLQVRQLCRAGCYAEPGAGGACARLRPAGDPRHNRVTGTRGT